MQGDLVFPNSGKINLLFVFPQQLKIHQLLQTRDVRKGEEKCEKRLDDKRINLKPPNSPSSFVSVQQAVVVSTMILVLAQIRPPCSATTWSSRTQ